MAKVTFIFTGIGLGHLKDDKWKIIFPFDTDGCHKVLFDDATNKPIPLNSPKTKVSITVVGGNKPAGIGEHFGKIFNLTGDQVHSNLSLKPNWDESAALLEIPNAVMSMNEPMQSLYNLEKNGTVIKDLDIIAFSAKAEIELLKNGHVKVDVNDNNNFPKTYNEADGDRTIVFNNNCDGNPASTRGDLQILYDLIIDVPPEEQFIIKRNRMVRPNNENLEKLRAEVATIEEERVQVSGEENHNPLFDDPSESLPCYFTVATKIDNFD